MKWKDSYLDLILVPLGLLLSLIYHGWLLRKVRVQPLQTVIGINSAGRRLWVLAMMKNNDKNNILAVQSIRNAIMGSTLMASTSILLCTGLAAVVSSTYSVKHPVYDSVYGAHGERVTAFKYVCVLFILLFAFLFYSLSVRFMSQVNFLINVPSISGSVDIAGIFPVEPEYVCGLMEKGFILSIVGNRLFYAALPLLLWIFGPVLVFLSSVVVVLIQYRMDIVFHERNEIRDIGV